ncbi:MAG: phosphodiester glycosidase family protein [Pyrinomonadaceae bacterium]
MVKSRSPGSRKKPVKSFVETRHPRTAVAKLAGDKFLMVTVDGRQPGTSVGMSLQELAEMLLKFGAVDAMNLDGGGSTTMFVGGKVINQPSDKEGERKVSDVIFSFSAPTTNANFDYQKIIFSGYTTVKDI